MVESLAKTRRAAVRPEVDLMLDEFENWKFVTALQISADFSLSAREMAENSGRAPESERDRDIDR